MKQNSKDQAILSFLQTWGKENHEYDLLKFHSMEFYEEPEEETFLEEWFDVDLSAFFDDKFYTFATEVGTGYLSFWKYNGLIGHAPIIRIDSYGDHPEMLAANLNDLVCRLLHNIAFNGGWVSDEDRVKNRQPSQEDFLEMCEDELHYHNEKTNSDITAEDYMGLINKERAEFKQRALEVIDFHSNEEIDNKIKQHHSFAEKLKEFRNRGMYEATKITVKNLEEKLISFDRNIEDGIFNIEEVAEEIYEDWPDVVDTQLFKDWLKKHNFTKK